LQVEKYMGRISGPLLDHIDLQIEVPTVPFEELSATADGTSSAAMREQVNRARAVERERFGPDSNRLNARMTTRQMRKFCTLDDEKKLLQNAGRAGPVGPRPRPHPPRGPHHRRPRGRSGDQAGARAGGDQLSDAGSEALGEVGATSRRFYRIQS
jgi:hypothetical protein